MRDHPLDCLVIGAGPAGLTAAIYLARYHLDTWVIDGGDSRAKWIPTSHNHAGFPDGINGEELLKRMREQAVRYQAEIKNGHVTRLEKKDDGMFVADWGSGPVEARTVLLATGVTNRRPPMIDKETHDAAMAEGLIRYCPVCDGYEVTDKRVGVIGTGDHAAAEASFIRGFTADITLISDGEQDLTSDCRDELKDAGIARVDGPITDIRPGDGEIHVSVESGETLSFDSIYPALGSDPHVQLAEMVGALLKGERCIHVDDHMRTNIEGLYAAGDVVIGLDQISNAMGQGGVASTTIRNDLAKREPIRRAPVAQAST
ncbi:NAD(P)/FAD-dependent oxidoreductase [Sphingomicrobium sp. XHP0235]|uniref:NAD(P)/FAD-dependent oxidoreductase n=1 Tax=Sphingomicrobium aquimarinum TaxID=3133971 RepID=UPI0031FF011A